MKLFKTVNYLLGLLLVLLFNACASRNFTYFSDIDKKSDFSIPKSIPTDSIMKGDLLSIAVSSADAASSAVFNAVNGQQNSGYLVDQNGELTFAKLGQVKAAGKTKAGLKTELEKLLMVYLKDPIVTIRQLNYKVTLIGEVSRPGTYTAVNERMTILEALGQAGDLTDFAKRDNVLIIREKENSQEYHRINLNDRASISSEYFYLRSNDVVYVEPVKTKKIRSSNWSVVAPIAISSLSFLISMIFLVNR